MISTIGIVAARAIWRCIAWALLAFAFVACNSDSGSQRDVVSNPARPGGVVLLDLDRVPRRPLDVGGATAHVLFFVATDCPIANVYAPEIRAIAEEYGEERLRFFVVHVDATLEHGDAVAHARDYGLPGPVLVDVAHELVRATGVTITPEVAVVTPGGVAYRGRIDNRYAALGVRRRRASRHDLRDALDSILAGEAPTTRVTVSVGCDIPPLR